MTTNDLLNEIEHRTAKVKNAIAERSTLIDTYIDDLKTAVRLIPAVRKAELKITKNNTHTNHGEIK